MAAQYVRAESYKIDEPYSVKETESNFECFNACIEDPRCLYVQKLFHRGRNCLFSDKVIEDGMKNGNAESITILGIITKI